MAMSCTSTMGQHIHYNQNCNHGPGFLTKTIPFLQALPGSLVDQLLTLGKDFVGQLSLEGVQLSTW